MNRSDERMVQYLLGELPGDEPMTDEESREWYRLLSGGGRSDAALAREHDALVREGEAQTQSEFVRFEFEEIE